MKNTKKLIKKYEFKADPIDLDDHTYDKLKDSPTKEEYDNFIKTNDKLLKSIKKILKIKN